MERGHYSKFRIRAGDLLEKGRFREGYGVSRAFKVCCKESQLLCLSLCTIRASIICIF